MSPPSARSMRRITSGLLALALCGLVAAEDDISPVEEATDASLAQSLQRERELLDQDRRLHGRLSESRSVAAARVDEVVRLLNEMVARLEPADGAGLADLLQQLEQAERSRLETLGEQRRQLARLSGRLKRITVLQEQLDELEGFKERAGGELTGRWELVFKPEYRRGTCELYQIGTLVAGTYRLEGGWDGSLRGTVVEGRILLERVDSQLGRTMELEGVVSSDGQRLRGSWLNFELADGGSSAGQWTAERLPEAP